MIGGVQQRHEFQREVVWLRESEARLQLVHRGCEVKELSTFNDFYGYHSAIKPEKSELDSICRTYAINSSTQLALIVVATVFEHPVVETPEVAKANREKQPNRKHQWVTVPDDWRNEVEIVGDKTWPRLERIELESRVV